MLKLHSVAADEIMKKKGQEGSSKVERCEGRRRVGRYEGGRDGYLSL